MRFFYWKKRRVFLLSAKKSGGADEDVRVTSRKVVRLAKDLSAVSRALMQEPPHSSFKPSAFPYIASPIMLSIFLFLYRRVTSFLIGYHGLRFLSLLLWPFIFIESKWMRMKKINQPIQKSFLDSWTDYKDNFFYKFESLYSGRKENFYEL